MGKRLDVLIGRLREDVEYTLRRHRSAPEDDKSFWSGAHATAACAVEWAEMARSGCMLGYGPNRPELRKRLAAQIALILRGTAPGDVAIELPVAFEFALNQNVAKALGVTIPFSVAASADEVIE